jgi:hypothetical protein
MGRCFGYLISSSSPRDPPSLDCVYLCSHLPCTFDEWVPILDFYLSSFFYFEGFFVCQDLGPSILYLFFSPFVGCFVFIDDCQVFIILVVDCICIQIHKKIIMSPVSVSLNFVFFLVFG